MASSSSSSSSTAAAASASNQRNNSLADVNPPADVAPPRVAPLPPPPPPPPPPAAGHAVYVQQLYRDPARRLPLRRELSFLCRTLIWALLIFIFTASLSVLLWLIFHPTFPQLHVTSAVMSAVTITNFTATAECNITLQLTNTNRRLTTIYDGFQILLIYPSQRVLLSQDYRPPFVQPKKTRTTIETNLGFTRLGLGNEAVKALKEDLDRGSLNLEIRIVAVVKYRNGKWKTKSQFMRAYCSGVSFGFTSSNKPGIFLNPYQECESFFDILLETYTFKKNSHKQEDNFPCNRLVPFSGIGVLHLTRVTSFRRFCPRPETLSPFGGKAVFEMLDEC